MAPLMCKNDVLAATMGSGRFADRPREAGPWYSSDPKLRARNVRYLQIGGDTWNRCGPGWLNLDGNFDAGDGALGENIIFVDDTGRFNMKHIVRRESRLPFADVRGRRVECAPRLSLPRG